MSINFQATCAKLFFREIKPLNNPVITSAYVKLPRSAKRKRGARDRVRTRAGSEAGKQWQRGPAKATPKVDVSFRTKFARGGRRSTMYHTK